MAGKEKNINKPKVRPFETFKTEERHETEVRPFETFKAEETPPWEESPRPRDSPRKH